MICKTCNTTKIATDFYVSNKTRCKECIKKSATANRNANLERVRSYDKLRSSMPHRVAARAEYRKTAAYAESHEAAVLRWSAKNPQRKAAVTAVGNAVRDGRLEKQPCWVCGIRAQAHHPDYDRPLDVVWLCQSHHKQAHALVANDSQKLRKA